MAFTTTVRNRVTTGGLCWEVGTWAMDGGTTTGTITPATSGNGITGGIREIYLSDVASDTLDAALVKDYQANRIALDIESGANDTGEYTLVGWMA